MPKFHDLSVPRAEIPPEMARGVDLAVVRDKKNHQHRWLAIGKYLITQDVINDMVVQMDRAMAEARDRVAAGEPVELTPIPIPLDQQALVAVEGPGCLKCGVLFTDPEKGNGKLCEVNDQAVEGLLAEQEQRAAQQKLAQDMVQEKTGTSAEQTAAMARQQQRNNADDNGG